MKIGILGTRGIPNNYGGFEHFAAHLSRGLVDRGHEVTVYNSHRHPFHETEWHGVKIVHCFDPEYLLGGAGQFVYDLNCILDARKRKYDVLLVLGYTSSSIWGALYPKHSVIITNMDGMEWKRAKFSKPVRKFLQYAEKLAVKSSDYHIADSPVIKTYLDKKYNIHCRYIAYGATLQQDPKESLLSAYGLKKQNYLMLMARMEPENNIEMILDGFCLSDSPLDFIVIGNTSTGYGKYIATKYKEDKRIRFLGAIFEEEKVHSLTAYCSLYFHGHSVGGTNPSLLDAMASGAPLAAHQNDFNKSVLQEGALYFSSADAIRNIIDTRCYGDAQRIQNNYNRIEKDFSWEMIIDSYEQYFFECCPAEKPVYELSNEKTVVLSGQYSE